MNDFYLQFSVGFFFSIYLVHTDIRGVQHTSTYSSVYITYIYTFVFVRETLIGRFM